MPLRRALPPLIAGILLASSVAASAQEVPAEVPQTPGLELPDPLPSMPLPGSPSDGVPEPTEESGSAEPTAGETGVSTSSEANGAEDPYIVVFHPSTDQPSRIADLLESRLGFDTEMRFRRAIQGFAASLTRDQVRDLDADPRIAAVVPDRVVRATAMPLVPGDSAPSGIRRIGAAVGGVVRGASGQNVAVIDTGIQLGHPDLNAINGKDCVGAEPALDENGHGTHVAGTIAAKNQGVGVTGVAPGTKVWAVRVLDASGSGSWSSVICGIDWVKGTRLDGDPSNDISVANMSLGGSLAGSPPPCPTVTDPMHMAICSAVGAGVTFVVAAGNEGSAFDGASPQVPAAYPEVLTVTSFGDSDGRSGGLGPTTCAGNDDDTASSFSNYASTSEGAAHTIAAPGDCIRSTVPGGYGYSSGTSMAAPHVAGAAALCLSEGSTPGPCQGMDPSGIAAWLRNEAAARSLEDPGAGFVGDASTAIAGTDYGHAVWAPDEIAPVVAARTPAAGAAVPHSIPIEVGFSEPMDAATTGTAITIEDVATNLALPGSLQWSGSTVRFVPSSPLAERREYRISVDSAATDLVGNELGSAASWTFRTLTSLEATSSSVTIQKGVRKLGSAPSLAGDDGSLLKVRSTSRSRYTSQWFGRLSTIPNDLADLVVTYSGRNSRSCSQKLALYRWRDGRWVTIDSRSVGSTERRIVRPVGDPGAFVSGDTGAGELRVRVRCVRSSSAFTTMSDQLHIAFAAS